MAKVYLHYSVVIQEKSLESLEEGEAIQLTDVIVAKIYDVKLIKCGSKVLNDWNLVA